MTRVLVPLDDSNLSRAALPVAAWLARKLQAEVVILLTVGPLAETSATAREEREQLSHRLADAAKELSDLPVQQIVDEGGDPVAGIIRTAKEAAVDLIVMSTHGRSPLAEFVQGSVAEAVVRAGVAPVTLVRPSDTGE
jgi:nucleotide-binding universal stress UspA family protein